MGDRASHRKGLELVSNNSLLNHILAFLQVCPMNILETPPEGDTNIEYYQAYFEAMLPCMVTSSEQVRRAAAKVEDRIFADPAIMEEFANSDKLKDPGFKHYYWTLT